MSNSAFTTKAEIWKYAAVLMGENPTTQVPDASNPSTPLELTFNTVYDVIRRKSLQRVKPVWAIEYETLREVPKIAWDGDNYSWDSYGWRYIYRQPIGALAFLGFPADDPLGGFKVPYMMRSLPIRYARSVFDNNSSGNIWEPTTAWNAHLWRDSIYGEWHDDSQARFSIYTNPTSLDDSADQFSLLTAPLHESTGEEQLISTLFSDTPWDTAAGVHLDFTVAIAASGYDVSAPGRGSVVLEYAYGNPYERRVNAAGEDNISSRHIYTNEYDAVGVVLMDNNSITDWDDSFAHLVATTLARRAAMVHAKSSKLMQQIQNEYALALNDAVADSWSPDDGGSRVKVSTAEIARR